MPKLIKLQYVLLCLLGLYPLLKFNFSSMILISFSAISVIIGIKYKSFNFSKKNGRKFLFLCSYFFLLLISITYSQNTDNAINRIIQFLPLLIAPFFVSFYEFQFIPKFKKRVLQIFVGVNILFTIIITTIFLLNINKTNLGILHFLLDYDKFQYIIDNSIDNDLIFIHKAYFSMGFVICAIFCLKKAIEFYGFNKTYFRIYTTIFLYFFFWLFYAFSFPNIVALIIGISILLYYNLTKKHLIKTFLLFTLICVSLVTFKLNDIDVQRGFNFVKSTVDEQEYEVNDARKEIYASHLKVLESASFLELAFGFGIGDPQDLLNEDYERRYLERGITNLLFFNEELDHLYWFKNNAKVDVNVINSPFGESNAEILIEESNDSIASHSISTNIDVSESTTYSFSIFAKKGGSNYVILRLGDIDQRATFDIEKGNVIKTLNIESANIKKVNNGWYRCSITVKPNTTNPIAMVGMSNENADYHYNSEGSGFYVWGAQLEKGNLTEYKKNGSELLKKATVKHYNSHNNYLYMILTIGCVGLITFLAFIIYLFRNAISDRNVLKITFCSLLALNFLTENILSRHWGLLFFAFMLLILFSKEKERIIE